MKSIAIKNVLLNQLNIMNKSILKINIVGINQVTCIHCICN